MSKNCCIGFGKCSYFYFYLFGAMITYTMKSEIQKKESFILNQFLLLEKIYIYCSYILFGLLFNWILMNNINLKLSKKDIFTCILVCFIYSFHFESLKIVGYFEFGSLNIWTAHIGFVIIFMSIYFPQNIYKHQLYPIVFVIFLDTILIIINTFLNNEDNKNIYQTKGYFICFSFIIYYICTIFFFSYSEVKIKILIDLKYLSPYIIILLIGITGLILDIIIILVSGFYGSKCNDQSEKNINCYTSVLSYFNKLKAIFDNNPKDFYFEILFYSPSFIIFEYLNMIFIIFIYKYLNPSYLIFSDNIYYTFSNLINFFFIKKKFDSLSINKFICSEGADILEFLVLPIYLELIELRFCGLNKNTWKNISLRGESEVNIEINDTSLNNELLDESFKKEKK